MANDTVSEKAKKVRSDEDTLSELEAFVVQNPLAAVAIATGAGFLLSQIRADRAVVHMGGIPFLLGALTTYMINRRS